MKKIQYDTPLKISGTGASPGIVIGKAYVIEKAEVRATGIVLRNEEEIKKEIEKFDIAVRKSLDELEQIKTRTGIPSDGKATGILDAHMEFMTDPQIRSNVIDWVMNQKRNAIDAVIAAIDEAAQLFDGMKDDYMRERAADIRDVGKRILKNLNHTPSIVPLHLDTNTIIVGDEILPSDFLSLDLKHVIGLALRFGGKTSHTAILAKAKGIPSVIGCHSALDVVVTNDLIIVDGTEGILWINPDRECIGAYEIKKEANGQNEKHLSMLRDRQAMTLDGRSVKLMANIRNADEMTESMEYGAEGVGLFRTELLFMESHSFPGEDDQFEYYRQVALQSGGKVVTVRTVDLGGDKPLKYSGFSEEENPFLGYRGIRICLDRKDIFLPQLKAILRASIFGRLRIMFPMISDVQELRRAKEVLEEAKQELVDGHIDFDREIPVGIMIEVPSAAIAADLLAREVSFFSIGTNDLCQYTLAVDRGNEKVRDLYDPFNPAVLRLIGNVIEQANKHHIDVGMCGELAADPLATLLLLGLGLEEFSMSAASIPLIKDKVLASNYATALEVKEKVMAMDNRSDIVHFLKTM